MTPGRRDKLVLAALLALAATLRLINLPGRGEWDDDQGTEMLAMLLWVRDGQIPLLGPISSTLTVHHGAGFYWMLAPAAFLTDAHPVAAVATMTVLGIAGVAAVWWLGATVGGPLAGHLAALLMAVSPSAITTSTFLWNANIVAPGAALATAAAWHAWRTRRARWWLLSALGAVVMLSGHLLAAVAVGPFAALMITDVVRRDRSQRLRMLVPVMAATAITATGFLSTLLYELSEVTDFFSADHPAGPAMLIRLRTIGVRVLAWPLTGYAEKATVRAWAAALLALLALTVTCSVGRGLARQFGWWAIVTTLWAVVALSVIAPTLATPFVGLPTDQYHTWLDPMLFAIMGVAGARLWAMRAALAVRSTGVAFVGGCVALTVASLPPLASADGGWPQAVDTALRIRSVTGIHSIAVTGVEKSGAAIEFPLRRQHASIAPPSTAEFLIVTCDPLFFSRSVLTCGGLAEAARAREVGFPTARVVDRFADGPRRVVSLFASH
ncbi:glycosyltransferase family 39 protein [Mycobacterium sp. 1423905.2]|uniref:ArnT family glycosyltransferase n=1 Tax=Mycobacterium sp. 1423905.2 TaxID=1856859 RepID=UPI0007FCB972|nr:glycosyltransferase family 39 protein [Mycobacterium sp. 1423905.2]OBJ51714.1 hypothetical protein A9W95_21725 [Mycobacterium sp. 1423905.2]